MFSSWSHGTQHDVGCWQYPISGKLLHLQSVKQKWAWKVLTFIWSLKQVLSQDTTVSIKLSVFVLCLTAKAPVILICGGKDIGKSTFARYLTNTFLNRYILRTVYFLIFYIIEWHYCAKIQLYIWYLIDQEMSFCPSVKTTVELLFRRHPPD